MRLKRVFRHLLAQGRGRRCFPPRVLEAIQRAIAEGERRHRGQVCFILEAALPLGALLRDVSPRARAHELFARFGVWDTEHNCGVLLYVLLPDRAIEIVADRGISKRVTQPEWEAIGERMRQAFAAGQYERGAVEGVQAVSELLARNFPADGAPRSNELPDRPVVL
jgi:uncharacterized membrane protein